MCVEGNFFQGITLCLDFKSYVGLLLGCGNKLSDYRHQFSAKAFSFTSCTEIEVG